MGVGLLVVLGVLALGAIVGLLLAGVLLNRRD